MKVKDSYPKGTIEASRGEDFKYRYITNEYGNQYPTESFDTDLEKDLLDRYSWLYKITIRDKSGINVPVFGDARTEKNILCLNENNYEFMNFLELPDAGRFEKYINDYQDVIDFIESKGFVEVGEFSKVSEGDKELIEYLAELRRNNPASDESIAETEAYLSRRAAAKAKIRRDTDVFFKNRW